MTKKKKPTKRGQGVTIEAAIATVRADKKPTKRSPGVTLLVWNSRRAVVRYVEGGRWMEELNAIRREMHRDRHDWRWQWFPGKLEVQQ